MSTNYNPQITTDNLVLCLDAANKRSYPGTGTSWYDLSGRSNHATLNGPTYSSVNLGKFYFDGSGVYAEVADSSDLKSLSGTISFWYQHDSVGTSRSDSVISKIDSFASLNGYNFLVDSAGTYFNIKSSTLFDPNHLTLPYSQLPISGSWYNMCLTYNIGTSSFLYVNGALDNTGSCPSFPGISSNPLRIGRSLDTFWESFKGHFSQLLIYNRVLTPQEVSQNFNALRGRYGI